MKTILVNDKIKIGKDQPLLFIAGPCQIESLDLCLRTAEFLKRVSENFPVNFIFKASFDKANRSSVGSARGPGMEEGLKILEKVRRETGLLIVTEATDHANLDIVEKYADIIQIGARNMQNYSLLRLAGKISKPVLLKRGFAATIDELLMAAEYIMSEGNTQVILCERGIRTFADNTRNTLDLSAIPSIKEASHLPIIVDPSHAAGRREYVISLSKGAIAVGADGLLVEVHHDPSHALSDGAQSLYPNQFRELMQEIDRLKN